ncbi:MAG: response regulator [Deltaproteobacteria bacterium]|nr:response regulator [Deltaproteobacteria bacterium]
MRTRSIKTELLLIGLLTTGAALLSMSAVLLVRDWLGLRDALLERLGIEATIAGNNCTAALTFDDPRAAEEVLGSLRASPGIQHVVAYDRAGAPFASFERLAQKQPAPRPPEGAFSSISIGRAEVFRPIEQDGERLGTIYIRSDTAGVEQRMGRHVGFVGLVVALSFLVALTLLGGLQRAITGPVLELAGTMRAVARSRDYTLRARQAGQGELATLVSGFNDMLREVEARDAELARQRESLETEVQRRTAELAAANQSLQAELVERQRMEKALVRAASEWCTTFDAISDGLSMLEADGTIIRCNKAAATVLGAEEPKGVLGKNIYALLGSGEALQRRMRELKRRVTDTQKYGARWFEVTLEPILDGAGEVSRCVHVLSDITEQRELQHQLSHAQKMEAIGRLAGGVAHDFNNILAVILSYSRFALEGVSPADPMRADLMEIQSAAERAKALTRQLLAFGRKQVVKPGVLKVDESIASLSKMIGRLIGENIALEQRLDPDLSPIFIDPVQFEQVLVNILVNARDAMPDGGRVLIEAANVVLTSEDPRCRATGAKPGGHARVSVTDTGMGMSKELQQRIFEPFFTTKELGKGTGLGLAIVYAAIKQCGGLVEVRSEVGKGTTFDLYFPHADQLQDEGQDGALRRERTPLGAGEPIVLVEDDSQLRRALRKLLERSGYRVIAASTGEEALTQLAKAGDAVRAVLTDIVMPGINGLLLGKGIRELHPNLPVIYMSGYSEEVLAGKDVSQLDAVLTKPFEDSALLTKLHEVLTDPTAQHS